MWQSKERHRFLRSSSALLAATGAEENPTLAVLTEAVQYVLTVLSDLQALYFWSHESPALKWILCWFAGWITRHKAGTVFPAILSGPSPLNLQETRPTTFNNMAVPLQQKEAVKDSRTVQLSRSSLYLENYIVILDTTCKHSRLVKNILHSVVKWMMHVK